MPVQTKKKLMIKRFLCIVCLLSLSVAFSNATNIKGQVKIDDSWEALIYLSVINSFDDLNTASYDFLIAQAEINNQGYFEINNLEIPKDERIYRLHICKKGDPISTIIIGGKDENFIHFIMKNRDSIHVNINTESPVFQHSISVGNPANESLRELFQLRKDLNSPPELPSAQSRKFIRDQVLEHYTIIADTSSHAIIQLITLYFINESFASSNQLDLMEKIQAKTEASDTSGPYYKAFLNDLSFIKYQAKGKSANNFIWLSGLALVILLGIIIFKKISKKKTSVAIENDASKLLSQLSVQEKRVLDLLKEGKSNKEISQELHIEVSTVKSHLNKIYSRLGVKSRREIINSD